MNVKKKINYLLQLIMLIYFILLLVVSSVACYNSYLRKKEQLLSAANLVLDRIDQQYSDILDNFWQVYMPFFEKGSTSFPILSNYFSADTSKELSPLEKKELTTILKQLKTRDSRIQWIGIHSEARDMNYILNGEILTSYADDFPFSDQFSTKRYEMNIFPSYDQNFSAAPTFTICGGSPTGMECGHIILGYSLNNFLQEAQSTLSDISSIRYGIISNGQCIFDSFETYDSILTTIPSASEQNVILLNGIKYYVKYCTSGNRLSYSFYLIPLQDLFLHSHLETPMILGISLIFAIVSFLIHYFINKSVNKEIEIIRKGVSQMAVTDCTLELPTSFYQKGLPEIAQNINQINTRLNENIRKAYYFELKQKDAQMAELQTAFNPHFLYNTLEMLRSKSYNNGDHETASLISQLSSFFRGLINAKTFISLGEELACSNRYLTLLNARYGDNVDIIFNISGDLLQYGIIKNVFQIILENYFVHGYDANKTNNTLSFTGVSLDENRMQFIIADNGRGISSEQLAQLNQRIQEPIRHGDPSYGLKNLNQRIKLFYGPDYGLHITSNIESGMVVTIVLAKITLEEYEEKNRLL